MKNLIILFLLFPVLVNADAAADRKVWLTKLNPNELYSYVFVAPGCPITTDEASAIVDGVLVRSRIKPMKSWETDEVTLDVSVFCISSDAMATYVTEVSFIINTYFGEQLLETSLADANFGGFGRDDKNGILDVLKASTERAITDYLRANFDLGEDE